MPSNGRLGWIGMALLLRDLLTDYPEHATLAQDLRLCEQEGDRITHDLIHRLNGSRHVRAPFDAGDGYRLATALDEILDEGAQAAATLGPSAAAGGAGG